MDLLLFLIAKHLNLDPSTLTPERAQAAVRLCMEQAVPRIAARMQELGFTSAHAMPRPAIQEALFLLWREILSRPSLAAAVRDEQSERVWREVLPRIVPQTTLLEVVALTMTALLHGMF
jgi:hypothetical protein